MKPLNLTTVKALIQLGRKEDEHIIFESLEWLKQEAQHRLELIERLSKIAAKEKHTCTQCSHSWEITLNRRSDRCPKCDHWV